MCIFFFIFVFRIIARCGFRYTLCSPFTHTHFIYYMSGALYPGLSCLELEARSPFAQSQHHSPRWRDIRTHTPQLRFLAYASTSRLSEVLCRSNHGLLAWARPSSTTSPLRDFSPRRAAFSWARCADTTHNFVYAILA